VVKGFLLLQKIFTHGSEGVDKVYSFIPVLPPLMILWLPRGKTRNITGYIPAVFLIFLTEALP